MQKGGDTSGAGAQAGGGAVAAVVRMLKTGGSVGEDAVLGWPDAAAS